MGKQINVDINTLKDRVCECKGSLFSPVLALKELPPILSSSGAYETTMVQVGFACISCGKILSLRPEIPKKEAPNLVVIEGSHNVIQNLEP